MVEVNIPKDIMIIGLQDQEGKAIDIQFVDNGSKLIFFAKNVPSKGYKVYRFTSEAKISDCKNLNIKNGIENNFFKVSFDNDFNITSIYDKKSEREVLKKGTRGNVLQAFEDRPMQWENWDIDIYYKRKMWEVNDIYNAEIIESGPVRYCVKLERNFCNSKIEQYIYFYKDIPRIDFKNVVDWKEKNILLKVAFPVDINSSKATYEIQYGNIERETHNNTSWELAKFEVCAHKWADLSEGEYGVSLMNDCKYGYDIKDGNMRLTLIKAGTYPNPEADLGIHEFTYSIYPHSHTWKEANTPRMAYNLNVPMYSVIEPPHGGELDDKMSLLRINRDNCLVEVVKKAEKNDGVIIRIYEYKNRRENVEIGFGIDVESAYECDPLENITSCTLKREGTISFEIKPYEIKTFLLNFKR
ncbi:MAG: glycosyl hydrolase 38 domain protein [Clostridiales bacterium]|nr:glycosyl hydrolase 38 domain protein [Clostridiales bacterium]